ncbi:MAG: VTT domain-containing protein [Candidatus Rifleibacteriota bacterium]
MTDKNKSTNFSSDSKSNDAGNIIQQGKNCWRLDHAVRASWLIDGENCFRAMREAMINAEKSIFIVGWDIHSALKLVRNGIEDDYPETLGDLLAFLAENKPDLHIYILDWDFAMIYAMERELFSHLKLYWKTGERLYFNLDSEHPLGGAQHQKIVTIDDSLAFAGGLDLTRCRWDTREHKVKNKLRIDPEKNPYSTFHDVHMMVAGDAAKSLSQLARKRWSDANGVEPVEPTVVKDIGKLWPAFVKDWIDNIQVGIARTFPEFKERSEIREVEKLYLDSIAAAEKFIYIENQFLSSYSIGKALEKRLKEKDGPEIIIILPEHIRGWLEHHTMDVLRTRLLKKLHQADEFKRLKAYFVRLDQKKDVSLMIHAKVMVIDDKFVRIGSSNISNRSMGLDSECDLAFEANSENKCFDKIRNFRRDLLAEHLGVSIKKVARAEEENKTLIAAIDSLAGKKDHTLVELNKELPPDVDLIVPDSVLIDPEKPVYSEDFLDYVFTTEKVEKPWQYWLKSVFFLFIVLGLLALWHLTPAGEWLNIDKLTEIGKEMTGHAFTPVLIFISYAFAGIFSIPITLMILATVMVFGPWLGLLYAVVGSQIAAIAGFYVGKLLGRKFVEKYFGERVRKIRRTLAVRGLLTIITFRIIPVAPFAVVNIIAGISYITFKDFVLGSFLGMFPGILATAFITESFVETLREPGTPRLINLLLAGIAISFVFIWLRRWLKRKYAELSNNS